MTTYAPPVPAYDGASLAQLQSFSFPSSRPLRNLEPFNQATADTHWPETRRGAVVTSIAGAGCPEGQTIYGASILSEASKVLVFSVESSGAGELTIEESTDGTTWGPTSQASVFLVVAGERGALRLTPTAAGRYFRPAFLALKAASKVWVLAQSRA